MELVDTPLAQLVPLTEKEEGLRKQLEEKIFEAVKRSFIEVGELLAEVKDRKLYKSSHLTFADYSRDVLDLAKQVAYNHLKAFYVVKNLSENTDGGDGEKVNNCLLLLPQNEAQARALVGLTPEEQRQVWKEAVETAPDGKVTAAHVRKTVRQLKGTRTLEVIEKTKREKAPNGERMSEEFAAARNAFLSEIQREISSGWATTDRLSVVRNLDAIRGTISENGNHRIPETGYAIEASNTEKLIDAGFTIIRSNLVHMTIEKLVGNSQWAVIEAFNDVDTLTRNFNNLLLDLKHLRG